MNSKENELISHNFIKNIIIEDLDQKKHINIITRFPPEPNGYLHIGHAKSICLNFGLAKEFNGKCNLRLDDTNPEKESEEYVNSIINDIKWLGFNWEGDIKYASDYFDIFFECALSFIKNDLAYVCDLSMEEMHNFRGTLTEIGKNSPHRNRSIKENLELFNDMKNGKYEEGSRTLRLKIDMSHPNINMRDPVIYRIKKINHIRTQDKWCIYPTYDYSHCISDAIEKITHSLCTLEFEDHRILYDWVIERLIDFKQLNNHPRQIEFSRLELQYTVTSKRKLNDLVNRGLVNGWNDPRMPTISGMKKRGYTNEAIKLFINRCGISKSPNIIDLSLLEASVRDSLETISPRLMAVINPLKISITNFSDKVQSKKVQLHQNDIQFGERLVELTNEIYIEKDDFIENKEESWHRLYLGGEVRLRYSYVLKCNKVIKDENGNIIELNCTIDYDTFGKNPKDRKIKGVIHWVNTKNSIKIIANLYDRLFKESRPDKVIDKSFEDLINPNSLISKNVLVEDTISKFKIHDRFQFERIGYFIIDDNSNILNNEFVVNKIVGLKDNWQ